MQKDVWTSDMIYGRCMNGTKLWILRFGDKFTSECFALESSTRINPNTVTSVLSRLFKIRAAAPFQRSDKGWEFIARSKRMLLYDANCTARFIQPGETMATRLHRIVSFDTATGPPRC